MKYLYILLTLLGTTVAHGQIVNIPDSNFKNALIDAGVDTNNDGEIQVSEAEAVVSLNVSFKDIQSMEGIQSFVNMEVLHCSNNQISSLDLSQNVNLQWLRCGGNQLSYLDVTQNLNLINLWCDNNELSDLDITQNLNLESLWCWNNPLGSIDVSQNLNLEDLACSNTQLNDLDVTQNINLENLDCPNNQLIDLNLSANINLQDLGCDNNQLVNLYINNGNNHNLQRMISTGNADLTCIQVDDENAPRPECDGFPLTGWCIDPWSSYSEDCSIGIAEIKSAEVAIYPNPTTDKVFVEANAQLESVRVFDLWGRKVLETFPRTERTELNFSTLKAGIYMAVISSEGKRTVKKIVKK